MQYLQRLLKGFFTRLLKSRQMSTSIAFTLQSDDLRAPSHCIHPSWDHKFTKLGVELRMTVRSLLWGCISHRHYFDLFHSTFSKYALLLNVVQDFGFFLPHKYHFWVLSGVISDQLFIEHYEDKKLLAVYERYAYCMKINESDDLDEEWVAAMLKRIHTLSTQLSEKVTVLESKCDTLETKCAAFDDSATEFNEMKKKVIVAEGEVVVLSSKLVEVKTKLLRRIAKLKRKLAVALHRDENDPTDDSSSEIDGDTSALCAADGEAIKAEILAENSGDDGDKRENPELSTCKEENGEEQCVFPQSVKIENDDHDDQSGITIDSEGKLGSKRAREDDE